MSYWSPSDKGITLISGTTNNPNGDLVEDNTGGWSFIQPDNAITLPDSQQYSGVIYTAPADGTYIFCSRNRLDVNTVQTVLQWIVGFESSGAATSEDITPYTSSSPTNYWSSSENVDNAISYEHLECTQMLQLAAGDIVFPFVGYIQASDAGGLQNSGYSSSTFWALQLTGTE